MHNIKSAWGWIDAQHFTTRKWKTRLWLSPLHLTVNWAQKDYIENGYSLSQCWIYSRKQTKLINNIKAAHLFTPVVKIVELWGTRLKRTGPSIVFYCSSMIAHVWSNERCYWAATQSPIPELCEQLKGRLWSHSYTEITQPYITSYSTAFLREMTRISIFCCVTILYKITQLLRF